ncbi:MAG: thioesterase [Alphaproteobacteria bacterium]|nr:thioesterase [Alphaproteobacteria bacterium]
MSFFGASTGTGSRLFCLPNAGGGTADFRRWVVAGAEVLPACLPGRETRLHERPYRSMPPLVEDLADDLPTDRPYALYGHSMGAWLAFELVRELRRRGARLPVRLIVAARHAPQVPTRTPPLGRLPQQAFLDGMQERYGAIPDVLLADPELLKAFLPALRADVVLLDDYRYTEEPALDVPIDVFHASDDPTVTRAEAEAWAVQTTAGFALHEVRGGHFFLREPGFDDAIAALL